MFKLIVFDTYLQKCDGGIFLMLSIIVPYEFQMLVFSLYSNSDMNAQSTIDGFNVFDQFDYTVMYFFPVV